MNTDCRASSVRGLPLFFMRTVLVLFWFALVVPSAVAQVDNVDVTEQTEAYNLPKISTEIKLDGVVSDEEWESVPVVDVVMYQPQFMGEKTEETEIRIAYDDSYVYVSGRLFDKDRKGIRGNTLYRDQYSGDDTFAIVLDPFNDNENALWFFTTPLGVRMDMAVANDANFGGAGRPMNSSWNTYWDVETTINDEGWFAEMRIPLSSLGFQTVGDQVVMGLITYRYIARKAERHIFPAIPPNWGMGFAKPSVAQDVTLEGVETSRPIYITPFVLTGGTRINDLNDSETAYFSDDNFEREIGLDFKYNLTSNLTLDLTANTDFAQVEADDQQVNLSRFSLFFPEKRQFFQERASIFEFGVGGRNRLFHSRQIGLNDGEAVRILGGARLVGRVGDWDVGVLNMQTASADDLPAENFGVARVRRTVVNENSYVGGLLTTRVGDDGSSNITYGLDGQFRLVGDTYLLLQAAQVFDSDTTLTGIGAESALVRAQFSRRAQIGFTYNTSISYVGDLHDPGIGFRSRDDYVNPRLGFGYGWNGNENSFYRQLSVSTNGAIFYRNEDGSIESADAGLEIESDFKSGAEASFEAEYNVEDLDDDLEFSDDAMVPAGRYDFANIEASYRTPQGRLLSTRIAAEYGSFYDGTNLSISLSPTWYASKHLQLGVDYQFGRLQFDKRDQEFTFHVARLRTQLAFNRKVSISAFGQVSTSSKFVSSNIRFRYNFAEGNDLWLVVNQGSNYDLRRETPFLPSIDNRSVLLKYTYTFKY